MNNSNLPIDTFIGKLGVLPVFLFHNQDYEAKQYALLNGNKNNFCIDLNNDYTAKDYTNFAWSSGVNNFLSINRDKSFLYRYDSQTPEEYSTEIIISNLQKFYEYIGRYEKNKENAIVPYILRIYRKLRNALRSEDGNDSLEAFFYLLASIENEQVDLDIWGLGTHAQTIAESINSNLWDEIYNDLVNGITEYQLKPNINLILRHTAGRLFEEANFIAHFTPELDLFPNEIIKYDYSPKQYGAYFTPPYLSRTIVEEVLLRKGKLPQNVTIFDPACGAGEFLVESLRQLKANKYEGKIKVIGWDIADTALNMAKFVLAFEKREWKGQLDIILEKRDSLANEWPQNIDLLFMNPPFMSWEQMKSNTYLRDQIKNILGKDYRKNPNLAAIFLLQAAKYLKRGGVMGAIIPSSVLNSDSHREIRENIKDMIQPYVVGKLGNFIFENAFVDACMIIAAKEKDFSTDPTLLWTQNVADVTNIALRELRKRHYCPEKIINEKDYCIYNISPNSFNQDSWLPVSYNSIIVKFKLEKSIIENKLVRIKDLFTVKQGIRTGLNNVFIIKDEFYNSLNDTEKKYFRPSIDSSSLKKGHITTVHYVFYPNTIGLKTIENEEDLKREVPVFYNTCLYPNKELLLKRARIKSEKWWVLSEHRAWLVENMPKIVSTEFGKAGNFAYDFTGEYIVERGCAWFPKKEKAFIDEYYYAYIAILNSTNMNVLLQIYSKQLAGGEWYNLDSKHIGNIPIPDLTKELFGSYISTLAKFGKCITNEIVYNREELNAIMNKIYDIKHE